MRIILIILLFTTALIGQADKRGNNWVIGRHLSVSEELMELDFSSDSVKMETFMSDHDMADPSITTYCDSKGELLLYSNGCSIYNRHHEVIADGADIFESYDLIGLCPFGYTGTYEGVTFVPQPCKKDIVHLINLDLDIEESEFVSRKLMRTTIDISNPDNPLILEKNALINEGRYESGTVYTTKHSNGLDWWVCLLQLNSSCYDCFQLSETGFSEPVVSCTGTNWGTVENFTGVGTGGFSPDGTTYIRFNFTYGLNIYDFDNLSGTLTHREQIFLEEEDFLGHLGAAISPNSRYLYASAQYRVYQFDLHADTIEHSGQIVDTLDFDLQNNHRFRISRLAPDGKIYIAGFNSPAGLHVIHKPDLEGKACNVEQLGMRFPEGVVHLAGLPNNPWYGELPDTSQCDSVDAVTDPISSSFSSIELYPNPSHESILLQLDLLHKVEGISISDMSGAVVASKSYKIFLTDWLTIDISELPIGIYILTLYTEQGKAQEKFIKI